MIKLYNIFIEMERIFLITLLILKVYSTSSYLYNNPSQNFSFTLGDNLINNSDIGFPVIKPSYYRHYPLTINGWTTKFKIVEYIDTCMMPKFGFCPVFNGVTCGWQFIDVDSYNSNQIYFQTFNFTEIKQYQIQFDWISQISYLIESTGIAVYWNGVIIDSFYDNNCTLYTETYYVMGRKGFNQIAFQGLGQVDSLGILLRNIKVRQLNYSYPSNTSNHQINNTTSQDSLNITYSFQEFYHNSNISGVSNILKIYQFINKYQIVKASLSVFNSQQNLRFIFGYIMEFNHFIPYNFHLRNFTLMSNFIIKLIQAIDDQKSLLTDQYIYPMLGLSPNIILKEFQGRADLPCNRYNIGSELIKRPNGMLLEISDLLLVDIPVTLVSFTIGYFLFKILFHFRVSLLFRQYSIFGLFFFILINGKVQILTFNFIQQILQFNSYSIKQKLLMVVILIFYCLIFSFSVAIMMLYQSAYKRLTKFIFENCRCPKQSLLFMTFSFGLFNLALGFAHRLLVDYPNIQVFVILFIQVAYFIALVVLLFMRFFENTLMGICLCLMNIFRILFITSCLFYSFWNELENWLSYTQEYLFYCLAGTCVLSTLLGILEKIMIILKAVKISLINFYNRQNRVQNDPYLSKGKKNKITERIRKQTQLRKTQLPKSLLINRSNHNKKQTKTVLKNKNGETNGLKAKSYRTVKEKTNPFLNQKSEKF